MANLGHLLHHRGFPALLHRPRLQHLCSAGHHEVVLHLPVNDQLLEGKSLALEKVDGADQLLPDIQVDLGLRMDRCRQLRSEEHTSELQSRENLVCRLLLEKKKKIKCICLSCKKKKQINKKK